MIIIIWLHIRDLRLWHYEACPAYPVAIMPPAAANENYRVQRMLVTGTDVWSITRYNPPDRRLWRSCSPSVVALSSPSMIQGDATLRWASRNVSIITSLMCALRPSWPQSAVCKTDAIRTVYGWHYGHAIAQRPMCTHHTSSGMMVTARWRYAIGCVR